MENTFELAPVKNEIIIAGQTIRTTNANGQSIIDHNNFWQRFYAENIPSKIPNISNPDYVYGVYSNYESDYTGEYDFTIGFEVSSTDNLPDDIVIIKIPSEDYALFEIKEAITLHEKIGKLWTNIWSADINRKYNIDFEKYENSSVFSDNPNIQIYISKK